MSDYGENAHLKLPEIHVNIRFLVLFEKQSETKEQ